jgi:hypothetical protein
VGTGLDVVANQGDRGSVARRRVHACRRAATALMVELCSQRVQLVHQSLELST